MKFKDKFLVQIVTCLTIIAFLNGAVVIKDETLIDLKEQIKSEIETNYTVEDIRIIGSKVLTKVLKAPESLNKAITVANEISYFTYPIDENSKEEILNVRAAAGGEVIYAGIDKTLGPCIRIKHNDKISTYGNLLSISVVPGERVKKAQIIGTYDTKSQEEFYYQLEDYMV